LKLDDGDIKDIITRTLKDTLKLSDITLKGAGKNLPDSLKLSALKRFDIIKLLPDTLKVDDGDIIDIITRLLKDSLKLSDVYSKEWTLARTYSDTLKLVDNYDRLWNVVRLYSENIKLSDVLTKSTARILEDVLKVDDGDITDIITRTLYENLKLSPIYSRIWSLSRTYSETPKLVDIVTKHTKRTMPKEFILLSDIIHKLPNKVLKNNLKVIDGKVALSVFKIIKMLKLFEEVFLEDARSRVFHPNRTLPELLKLSPVYARIWDLSRTYTQNLVLSPVLKKATSRELIDTLKLIDVLAAHRYYGRILSVSLKLSDNRKSKTNKLQKDNLKLADILIHTYLRFINLSDALKLSATKSYIKIRYGNLSETLKLNAEYLQITKLPNLMLLANNIVANIYDIASL
jgi:hypothetical protein